MAKPRSLSGRSAVVTGSTSGIGLGIARALAEAGAHVALNGFGDDAEIEAERKRIEDDFGVTAIYHDADMTQPERISDLIETAEKAFGGIDILVNNAGIQHVAPIEEFPVGKWDAILAIVLTSAFHTTRLTLPSMKQRGFGRIVNLASAHALIASPYKAAYVAAKHGMAGLTKTVALEAATFGVTCNAICPGYVKTPLVEQQIPETARSRGITEDEVIRDVILAAQPTKQFVEVAEIGALAVFLCGPAAASINGAILPMDGGWSAQ